MEHDHRNLNVNEVYQAIPISNSNKSLMTPLQRLGTIVALSSLVAMISGCSAVPGGDASDGEDPVEVVIGAPEGAATAPLYIAHEKGYFANANLDVEFVPVDGSSDLAALLSAGDIDFATAQPSATFYNSCH